MSGLKTLLHRKDKDGAHTWNVEVQTHNAYDSPLQVGANLAIIGDDGVKSVKVPIDDWKAKELDRPGQLPGRRRLGSVTLPGCFARPAAVSLTLVKDELLEIKATYIVEVILTKGSDTLVFPAHSTIHQDQGERIFFEGTARLPADTPKGLQPLRAAELAALKGEGGGAGKELKPWDRVYDYDTYNDLGGDQSKPGSAAAAARPTLGGSSALPYPRRLRTGRPLYPGTDAETLPTTGPVNNVLKVPVVPFDDDFTDDKTISFLGSAITAALPTVLQTIGKKMPEKPEFVDFEDVYDTFYKVAKSALPPVKGGDGAGPPKVKSVLDEIGIILGNFPAKDLTSSRLKLVSPQQLVTFTVPFLLQGRPDAWQTDQEFARQFLAGQNPFILKVLTSLPSGSAITAELIKPIIAQGTSASLESLMDPSKPRLFVADHMSFADYLPVEAGTGAPSLSSATGAGVYHAGRAVLYLSDDGLLLPAAVELASVKRTPGGPPELVAYTPKLPSSVWLLAKTIFSSVDSAYHQLMSHFVRTHASCEPYLIALRRTLSSMHPVFKLMLPHFRYTLTINADARALLINAGGVFESLFTPGKENMSISSVLYGKEWEFETEGLVGDLKSRGFLSHDNKLLVDDYPYAADGLLIWNALTKYFESYLRLYYDGPAAIAGDPELQAFYLEVKTKGHPDKKKGWPKLETLQDLANILATMAWTASAHHAAVNFGQYAYSSFMPNRPSFTTRPAPVPGTPAYEKLAKFDLGTKEAQHEILSYLSGPTIAGKVMTVLKLLSSHSPDEQYLSDEKAEWLTDKAAQSAHAAFVKELLAAEKEMERRNSDPKYKSRSEAAGGLPYTLLCPSSGQGITGRGIPYSVSI